MKKLGLSLALFASLLLSACQNEGINFNLSEKQIEVNLASYFPYHKEALYGSLKLDLKQPDLILKKGSQRAELVLDSTITAAGSVWPGKTHFTFGVDYDPKSKTFYLIEPRIEKLNFNGVPNTVSSGITQYLLPVVQQYLTRVPVYTLTAKSSTGQNIASAVLKKVAIEDQNLKVTLGWPEK